jgi:hypothetical protein
MSQNVANDGAQQPDKKDCGCGCNGSGDCGDKEPKSQVRRALLAGAGSSAVIATLINRRAFAGSTACGPLSRLHSLNQSQANTPQCGGLTPGFWQNHKTCAQVALNKLLGTTDLTSKTLGQALPILLTLDPTAANTTFKDAICGPSTNAFHWDNAILSAASPSLAPSFGYSIKGIGTGPDLNTAISNASAAGSSLSDILNAIELLENDFNVNDGTFCGGSAPDKVC